MYFFQAVLMEPHSKFYNIRGVLLKEVLKGAIFEERNSAGSSFKESNNMAVRIISFGQIAELTGNEFMAEITDTDQLATLLQDQYKLPAEMKYLIAVNKKTVNQNTSINEADVVALLPPYSGG